MPQMELRSAPAVQEYLRKVDAALQHVPIQERELLLGQALAEVELESELRYADPQDAAALQGVLDRLDAPERVAARLDPRAASKSEPLGGCRVCQAPVSSMAHACPRCGAPFPARVGWNGTGYEWKSPGTFRGIPLVHVAWGRDAKGKLRVAKGVVAIGQFGIGAFTIAQFGVGLIFGFGQFVAAPIAIGQFALGLVAAGQFGIGILAGAGQFATGIFATGMKAFGVWVRSMF